MTSVVKRSAGIRGVELPPVHIKQFPIRDRLRIVNDLHGFHVTGGAAADFLVRRILFVAAGVAGNHGFHAS